MFDSNEVVIRPENRTDVFICSPARKATGIAKQPHVHAGVLIHSHKNEWEKNREMNRETKRTHAHNLPSIQQIHFLK